MSLANGRCKMGSRKLCRNLETRLWWLSKMEVNGVFALDDFNFLQVEIQDELFIRKRIIFILIQNYLSRISQKDQMFIEILSKKAANNIIYYIDATKNNKFLTFKMTFAFLKNEKGIGKSCMTSQFIVFFLIIILCTETFYHYLQACLTCYKLTSIILMDTVV